MFVLVKDFSFFLHFQQNHYCQEPSTFFRCHHPSLHSPRKNRQSGSVAHNSCCMQKKFIQCPATSRDSKKLAGPHCPVSLVQLLPPHINIPYSVRSGPLPRFGKAKENDHQEQEESSTLLMDWLTSRTDVEGEKIEGAWKKEEKTYRRIARPVRPAWPCRCCSRVPTYWMNLLRKSPVLVQRVHSWKKSKSDSRGLATSHKRHSRHTHSTILHR